MQSSVLTSGRSILPGASAGSPELILGSGFVSRTASAFPAVSVQNLRLTTYHFLCSPLVLSQHHPRLSASALVSLQAVPNTVAGVTMSHEVRLCHSCAQSLSVAYKECVPVLWSMITPFPAPPVTLLVPHTLGLGVASFLFCTVLFSQLICMTCSLLFYWFFI